MTPRYQELLVGVKSTPFGPVMLSGQDAVRFKEIVQQEPSREAVESLRRGLDLVEEMERNGRIGLALRSPPTSRSNSR